MVKDLNRTQISLRIFISLTHDHGIICFNIGPSVASSSKDMSLGWYFQVFEWLRTRRYLLRWKFPILRLIEFMLIAVWQLSVVLNAVHSSTINGDRLPEQLDRRNAMPHIIRSRAWLVANTTAIVYQIGWCSHR